MEFVGKYHTYPDTTGKRAAEGGLRLQGYQKQSQEGLPLVTIMTVCYNSSETIAQTFQSIRDQSYSNIEYVVVDGGSSDGTVDILKANADLIDYYVSEPDKGLYHAMNKGLELAQGKFILILNSDDWYEPFTVQKLVEAQAFSACDFVGGLARYINADGSTHVLPSMAFDHSTLLRMPLRHQTMFMSAELYDRTGPYDTSFPIIADYDYAIRLYQAGATYFEVPEALLNFRTSGVSSTAWEQLHNEHRALLHKVFPFLTPEEVQVLGDHSKAKPENFIAAANKYVTEPDFVLAVRAMLKDFKRLWGGPWAEARFDLLAADAPAHLYPKISLVMPVYKAEGFIRQSLEKALSQSFQDIEVICVDDCGPDNSLAVMQEFAQTDPRVRVLQNPQNMGPGAARNRGIRAARGQYVFFLDADDNLTPDGLSRLYEVAQAHDSQIVRGAWRTDRKIHGEMVSGVKHVAGVTDSVLDETTLALTPDLLASTEGHWACLYERGFVETILYPESLEMGEDSLFLIKALSAAQKVSVVPDVVYEYQDSDVSAMNTYSLKKYMDEITWRKRAWGLLNSSGNRARADYFLFDYWNPPFFDQMYVDLAPAQITEFYTRLYAAFTFAGDPKLERCTNPILHEIFWRHFADMGFVRRPLQIATLTTSDSGGAGIASQRCMRGLRSAGQEAFTVCIFKKYDEPNVYSAPLTGAAADYGAAGDMESLWDDWMERSTLSETSTPKTLARELFSRPEGIVDAGALGASLSNVDLVHLHWSVGLIDFDRIDEMFGDTPVVWTLHDMNAFTGGCHYSEGCEGYKDGCHNCPLLEPGSTFAHDSLMKKAEAYAKIPNLHIICPSQWLADCAKSSTLLKDRPVHMIPNLIPLDDFVPTNRIAARIALDLPLDKKLIVFGADSLENVRKGGHLLRAAVDHLRLRGELEDVEGLFFGSSNLDVGIPGHNLGYISDPKKLSLVYAAADVFAFPSLEDNAPQTVVEALLSGTPVVGYPVGNVTELVQHRDTGYIADYADAEAFADGLSWAFGRIGSREAILKSVRGHLHAHDYHTPQPIIQQHVDLFYEVTGAKPPPAGA